MTMLSPVVEWRAAITPFGTISTLALTGVGSLGAIPVGTTSNVVTVRIYNNFAGASSIADALNCVLAVYDDAVHQGIAIVAPSMLQYLQVEVTDYNGVTTGQDTLYYAIGGSVKHPIPVNGGTLGGTTANYATINVIAVIPAIATQAAVSQALWLEYSSTA